MCELKKCTKCLQEKDLDSFGKSKKTKSGKQQQCKSCILVQSKIASSKIAMSEYGKFPNKVCCKCGIDKPIEQFSNCNSTKDGKMYDCKECRKRFHTPKREGVVVFSDREERKCSKCELIKPFVDFYESKTNIGVTSICRDCTVIYRREVKTRNKIIPDFKTCTKCNINKDIKSFVKDKSKLDGVSSTCKKCTNKWRVEKCKNDPIFKFTYNTRRAITQAFSNIARGKYVKDKSSEIILSIPLNDFYKKIEIQFLDWMSWDNYGNVCGTDLEYSCSWDLDHCVPLSYAKTKEMVEILNHWSNFQPLCSKINRDDKKANFYPCTNLELGITFWEDRWEYV